MFVYAALDQRLRGDFQWAAAMVDQTPDGGITWYGFVADVTDRKGADDRSRIWERVFEKAGIGIALADAVTNQFVAVNRTFAAMRGYSAEEVVGQKVASAYGDRWLTVLKTIQSADATGHAVIDAELILKKAFFTDVSPAVARWRKANKLPAPAKPFDDLKVLDKERRTDEKTYTVVNKYAGKKGPVFRKIQCNHCQDAPCEKVCPTGATYKRPDGIVLVDADESHVCVCSENGDGMSGTAIPR